MSTVMAVSGGGSGSHLIEREQLMADLHDAVKKCQVRFGGRAELATESDPHVASLCCRLEAALSHGLRSKPLNKTSSAFKQMTEIVSTSLMLNRSETTNHVSFWHYVTEHLTKHEYERYLLLKQVWTDIGRGRAWLRSSLNEHSLERYLHCLIGNPQQIAQYYEEWALLLDQELSSNLPTMARGLGPILFAISIDKIELNQWHGSKSPNSGNLSLVDPTLSRSEPIIIADANVDNSSSGSGSMGSSGTRKKSEGRRKRKGPTNIISFDDDDTNIAQSVGGVSSSFDFKSAPPTCLNSPITVSVLSSDWKSCSDDSTPVANPPGEMKEGLPNEKSGQSDKKEHKEQHLIGPSDSTQSTVLKLGAPIVMVEMQGSDDEGEKSAMRTKSGHQSRIAQLQTLTPVNNLSVGELIPVSMNEEAHSEEDSLSVPSYSEDTDCAAAALIATQKLLQNTTLDYNPPEQPSNSARSKSKVELPAHVNGEVRDALLAVLTRKEELQKENRHLKRALEESQEKVNTLQAEITESSRMHLDKVERVETRLQALNRENELLKHQLRKYVGAVQMLRRDGSQAHEMLSQLAGAQLVGDPPDYHTEAREYERKLIQVAEMHGELMEFNERLHRALQAKDTVLRRLRDELVDLRGPLPDEPGTSDDDAHSVTSDYDGGSICTAARALVNIWVPSAFLTGGSSDVHHVYQVFIRIRDDEWNIYRRYAQFYALHKDLKKQDAVVGTFDFPPKKALGNKDARFVEERRKRLQHYLRCVMNHLIQTNAELSASPDKELLVHMIPFFGEICSGGEDRTRRKRTSSRNPFTRLTRVNPDSQSSSSSPQYTGL